MRIKCGKAVPGYLHVTRELVELAVEVNRRRLIVIPSDAWAGAWTMNDDSAIGDLWRWGATCPVAKNAIDGCARSTWTLGSRTGATLI